MAQIKIYGIRENLRTTKKALSEVIHETFVNVISLPKEKKFHRFILLDKEDFIYPSDRSDKYIILEIMMISGRKSETKKTLIKKLFENIEHKVGIEKKDIEICIMEAPSSDWGFRGICGDEVKLNYEITI